MLRKAGTAFDAGGKPIPGSASLRTGPWQAFLLSCKPRSGSLPSTPYLGEPHFSAEPVSSRSLAP